MGIIRMGPPAELMLKLKRLYELDYFIETGTYKGDTAAWATIHFDKIVSIELSRQLYDETSEKYQALHNVSFIFGDSRSELREIVQKMTRPAIFWLDSHWSEGQTYGETDECPLIDEIGAINSSSDCNFLFIDDARLFMSPPPKPHRIEQWPSIVDVMYALNSGQHKYYVVIFEDVIIAVPDYAKEIVSGYCQERTTRAWQNCEELPGSSVARSRVAVICQNVVSLGRSFFTRPYGRLANLLKGAVRR